MTETAIIVIVVCVALSYFCCAIKKIEANIEAMRHEYLDMLKQEVEQVHSCFGYWKETIDSLDCSIDMTKGLLEVLRNERADI